MRKKVKASDVREGMFIDEVCGSWMESPFWKSSFKVNSEEDLKSLQGSGIKEVWIDTDKGIDVADQQTIVNEKEDAVRTQQVLSDIADKNPEVEQQVDLKAEIENARRVQTEATAMVTSMFQESRMGKAIEAEKAMPMVNEIYLSVVRNQNALISLTRLKTKDDYTYMHSVAVAGLMIALGRQLDLEEELVKSLGMAGLLHDIGKMKVSNDILNKPGRLTDEEFEAIKTHPERGWQILKDSDGIDDITLDVCLHHHERIDGRGYPEKLNSEQLSLFAKMGAVCDVYDAITSNRPYKNGWTPTESIRKMASWKDGHFDEDVFNNFVKTIGIYPVGSLLKMKSGRLGVVIEQNEQSLLTPKVKLFYSTSAGAHITPQIIDLKNASESIAGVEEADKYGFDLPTLMGS